MHANDVFLFFKNYFWHQHIKTIQNVQTILNFSKKKIMNFLETRFTPRSQTCSESSIWLLKIWIWWCLALKVMWFLCLHRGKEEIIQRESPNLCKCSFCVYVVYNIKVSLSFILFYFKLTKDIKYNFLKHRKKQSNYCRLNIIFPVIFFVLMSFSNY
jgi:hypothetical protein